MPVKKYSKKTTRQKRLIKAMATTNELGGHALDGSSPKGREAAIIRQFHQIQKGYAKLMVDVAKELDLVKGWIGTQAQIKRNDIKARLSSRLSRH